MTTSSKYLNPPFDPRILKIGNQADSKKLKRGRLMLHTSNSQPELVNKGVQFLFNPVSVDVSHNIDWGNVISSSGSSTPGVTYGNQVNMGGVSVSLLYDRTYELWDGSKKNTLAGQYGVYADVLAYYQLLGITPESTVTTKAPEIYTISYFNQYPTRPIDPSQRYYLYMGDTLRWYGTLTDFQISYTHFNRNMIPTRAAISLSLMFQVDNGGAKVVKGVKKGAASHKSGFNPYGPSGPIGKPKAKKHAKVIAYNPKFDKFNKHVKGHF